MFAVVLDPVGLGLVESLARPAGNFTGTTYSEADLGGKRLEFLIDALPETRRVAVLWGSGRASKDASKPMRGSPLVLRGSLRSHLSMHEDVGGRPRTAAHSMVRVPQGTIFFALRSASSARIIASESTPSVKPARLILSVSDMTSQSVPKT